MSTAQHEVGRPGSTRKNTAAAAAPGDQGQASPRRADTLEPATRDRNFVTALARGLAVILAFSEQKRRLSMAQVSHRTGIPRAAVRRSLRTLTTLGFVAMDDERHFFLRPKILSLGHAYLSATPLSICAQPVLNRLGQTLGEGCSLAILDGDEIVYLSRSTSSRILSPSLNVGSRLPAYSTSIGQVLLAHLPTRELASYLRRAKLRAFTEQTMTSREQLRAALTRARQAGYAIADQQMEIGLRTMAVPVRDASGTVVAGINVICPVGAVALKDMTARFLVPLQRAAQDLGALLSP
jgi:IclR family transcriptional regulator, pca regulon regulatory protein